MDLTASPGAATELHRSAEALLAHLAAGCATPLTSPKPPDIEGHWLPPAIEALTAIMAGEDSLEPLTHAAQRDERRTALFLCLALAVAGLGDRIHASWLGIAFGDLSANRPVTHGQRALWVSAARGSYGPAGKIFVLRKLDSITLPPETDIDRWLSSMVPTEPAVVVPRALADFPELAEIPQLARPAQAATRLARLLSRCEEITSRRADEILPPVRNSAGTPANAWMHAEPMAALRSLIGTGGPQAPTRSLIDHLLDDLAPGADPNLAAAALHVVAPIIRSAAAELAEATRLNPPTAITVPILGHTITLRPQGPDPESLTAAERQITSALPSRPGLRRAYAGIVLGVALVITSLVVWGVIAGAGVPALGLAALGAGLCGTGLWTRHRETIRSRADANRVASQCDELRELAERAVWALHEYAREAEERSKTATDNLATLTRLIRRGPRAI